jgi:hypothetical protein
MSSMLSRNNRITILTGSENKGLKVRMLSFHLLLIRYLRHFINNPPLENTIKYGGHFAVTRSLLEGFQSIGQKYIYNPKNEDEYSEFCVVLSGRNALEKAIALKRKGRIKVLLAGPNLFLLPTDFDNLIYKTEINSFLVPSIWILKKYIKVEPKLSSRIKIWPAGVDISNWPKNNKNKSTLKKVLFYIKSNSLIAEANKCESILKSKLINVERLTYGNYKSADYKKLLSEVDLCVFFSPSESQGIALAESWASDVPTWVYERGFWTAPTGDVYSSSSAPYLTDYTGDFFTSINEFSDLINSWQKLYGKYSPRKWVHENMTDQICAFKILELLRDFG